MKKGYTKEDILRMVEEEDVEFIRLQFTDMFGCLQEYGDYRKPVGEGAEQPVYV